MASSWCRIQIIFTKVLFLEMITVNIFFDQTRSQGNSKVWTTCFSPPNSQLNCCWNIFTQFQSEVVSNGGKMSCMGITWKECLPAPSLGLPGSRLLIPAARRWLAGRFRDGAAWSRLVAARHLDWVLSHRQRLLLPLTILIGAAAQCSPDTLYSFHFGFILLSLGCLASCSKVEILDQQRFRGSRIFEAYLWRWLVMTILLFLLPRDECVYNRSWPTWLPYQSKSDDQARSITDAKTATHSKAKSGWIGRTGLETTYKPCGSDNPPAAFFHCRGVVGGIFMWVWSLDAPLPPPETTFI